MNDEKTGLMELSIGVLKAPQSTFKRINERNLVSGLIIINILGILKASSTALYVNKIPIELLIPEIGQAGADASRIAQNIGTISAIGGFLSVLVWYIITVFIIHGMGIITGDQGSIKKVLTMNGFASIPFILQQLLRFVDSIVTSPESLTGFYISKMAVTGIFMKSLVNTNVLTLFGVYTWLLIGYATSTNYGISRRKALIFSLVPFLVFFFYNYYFG